MLECIFSPHCTESVCDRSCPTFVQTSYLLERNGISINSHVYKHNSSDISHAVDIVDKCTTQLGVVITDNTIPTSELLTYCAICKFWQGSQLHCAVYNLKYSQFIESVRRSWSTRVEGDDIQYARIWSNSAKLLIVSNIDYVNFGDYESQTLLNLVQQRQSQGLGTIIVSPPTSKLIGKSLFFKSLKELLDGAVIR